MLVIDLMFVATRAYYPTTSLANRTRTRLSPSFVFNMRS